MECESTLDTQNKHLANILTRVRVRIQLAKPTGCTRYATIPRGFCTFFARRNAGGSSGVREKRAHARPARPGPHVSFLSGAGPSVTIPCPTDPAFPRNATLFLSQTRTGPAETRKSRKKRKPFHSPIFFLAQTQEAKNIPRRNQPLHRQGAGDTAKPSYPLRRRRRRDKEKQEQRTLQEGGSGSLGEGDASRSCRRGTRARRRADSVILAE
jgi:hypothetical protein